MNILFIFLDIFILNIEKMEMNDKIIVMLLGFLNILLFLDLHIIRNLYSYYNYRQTIYFILDFYVQQKN